VVNVHWCDSSGKVSSILIMDLPAGIQCKKRLFKYLMHIEEQIYKTFFYCIFIHPFVVNLQLCKVSSILIVDLPTGYTLCMFYDKKLGLELLQLKILICNVFIHLWSIYSYVKSVRF